MKVVPFRRWPSLPSMGWSLAFRGFASNRRSCSSNRKNILNRRLYAYFNNDQNKHYKSIVNPHARTPANLFISLKNKSHYLFSFFHIQINNEVQYAVSIG